MKTTVLTNILILFLKLSNAQYISEIIEYTPAPGQFINTTYGNPTAAQSVTGGITGTVSLGAFGGCIIFKFQNPVENNPDNPYGIDFTVFGNPASSTSSEPGIVYVMKDENNNGLPDDIWYELAGSDYFFSSTIKNYEITYTNPQQSSAADVPWTDNFNNSGFVYANSYHTQAYYPDSGIFPDINQESYTLSGTRITAAVDKTNSSFIKSYQRAFGYADNHLRGNTDLSFPDNPYTQEIEGTGGDAFDISWATDENGNYIDLNEINFVKIQCAVNSDMAWLGEVSTEITGAVDVAPDASISGIEDMVVIKDLPPVIYIGTEYQLEGFAFHKGRLQSNVLLNWSVDMPEATIDENLILKANQTGNITVTASINSNPDVRYSISAVVSEPENTGNTNQNNIKIYPVPCTDYLKISNVKNANIEILNTSGMKMSEIKNFSSGENIDVSYLKSGVYFLKISRDNIITVKKIAKK